MIRHLLQPIRLAMDADELEEGVLYKGLTYCDEIVYYKSPSSQRNMTTFLQLCTCEACHEAYGLALLKELDNGW